MRIANINKIGVVALVVVLASSFTLGQGARNGTAAASQLLIPQGAQYLSGGGAVATASGIEATYWNPAGLARSDRNVDAIFSRRNYIADIDLNYFGAGVKLGGFGSIAVTVRALDIGEIEITDVFNPDGTGEQFSPSIFVAGATYSRLLTDKTSIGVSVNYLSESFTTVGVTGITLDAGVQYSSFLNVPNLTIGVALRNFGRPMRYSGSGLWVRAGVTGTNRPSELYKVEAAAFDVPFVMDLGATYSINLGGANSIDLGVTFENNDFAQDELKLMGTFNLGSLVSVRGAFVTSEEAVIRDDPNTSVDESDFDLPNIFAGVSFGASVNLKSFTGIDISLDYAFIATEFFDDNQVISVRFGF